MTELPKYIFACDPGLVSGVAMLALNREGRVDLVNSYELPPDQVGSVLEFFLRHHNPETALVVAERFTISMRTVKNSAAPWSLEVIGMMKYLVSRAWGTPYDRSVVLQSPADAKGLISNELLKANGLWHRGGAGHARDGIRHGAYTYAKLGVRYFWD